MKAMLSPAFYRYVRYLPLRMLAGKAKQVFVSRFMLMRVARTATSGNVDWVQALSDPRLSAFSSVYRVQGNRFGDDCVDLHWGKFSSNGVSHEFGSIEDIRWGRVLTEPIYVRWQHDLAYFAYSIPLVARDADLGIPAVAAMVEALETQLIDDPRDIRNFHWSPIAVASRVLALVSALSQVPKSQLIRHSDAVATVGRHIWKCGEILGLTVERYLSFNHAVFTETGLAVALLVQGRLIRSQESVRKAIRTLEECTLADGMWAERSPTYHIHMLILADALMAMHDADTPEYRRLEVLSARMRSALSAVVHPDGEIAIFNDSAIADAPRPSSVGWTEPDAPHVLVLPDAGYARVQMGGTVVIMDAGPMGPDAVLAHGHADFLAVEVSIGRKRVIVDPGVASITAGEDRQWTRSASSHNGPTLRGCEPAEFFGAWRVGRRGRAKFTDVHSDSSGSVRLSGACDGYREWGVTVERTIVVSRNGELLLEDRWLGEEGGTHTISFLIPAEWTVKAQAGAVFEVFHADGTCATITVSGHVTSYMESARFYREGPMREECATRLLITAHSRLVVTAIEPRAVLNQVQ